MWHVFRDPSFRLWYLVIGLALLVLPPIVMALWYHRKSRETAAGRDLMKRQNRMGVRAPPRQVAAMARDIAVGRYGADVASQQRWTYVFFLCWFLVNAAYFGLMIYADAVNKGLPP